ncbi:unnamed protein product [Ostreobium quekettii]|uniref:EamA domain-containing protein n=1 Tax=Ostreobium quekettii TaxID=121088 RepID=A0A8S1J6R6_9CHLO|nr:unnamed protein product [Ostreobium quekettii]
MASFAPLGVPAPWRSDPRRLLKRLRPLRATETESTVEVLDAPGGRRDPRVAEGRKLLAPRHGTDLGQKSKAVAAGEGVAVAPREVNVDASGAMSLARVAGSKAESMSSADEEDGAGKEVETAEGMFSGSLKGLLLLNLGAAMFGSNQVVIKTTERHLSPGALSAIRFLIAAVAFSPSIVRGLQMPKLRSAAFELGCWLFGE